MVPFVGTLQQDPHLSCSVLDLQDGETPGQTTWWELAGQNSEMLQASDAAGPAS